MQAEDTPAKQFLAALARASQRVENALVESYEEAHRFNDELSEYVKGQIVLSDTDLEDELRKSTDLVEEDKQRLLAELAELQKEEIRVLSAAGKQFRDALTTRLDELSNDLQKEIKANVKFLEKRLAHTENGITAEVSNIKENLATRLAADLAKLNQQVADEKINLEEAQKQSLKLLSDNFEAANGNLEALAEALGEELRGKGRQLIDEIKESAGTFNGREGINLEDKIESLLQARTAANDKLRAATENDVNYVQELPAKFGRSCRETALIHVEMHSTALKNLAVRYKTELLSAGQQSEDQIKSLGAEVQSTLRQYQASYSKRFDDLLAKFESSCNQTVQDFVREGVEGYRTLTGSKERELKQFFHTLRRKNSEDVKAKFESIEKDFDSLYEECRGRLEKQRADKTAILENECQEARTRFNKIAREYENQAKELDGQLRELEMLCSELEELISVLFQAGLDF